MESKRFNATHRLLHWSIGLSIIILLGTALLHITWFGREQVAKIIQDNLQLFDIRISLEDAGVIAKRIALPMWNWHFYAGYVLVGLYALRCVHLAYYGIQFPSPLNKANTLKQRVQGATYILFYVLLGITTFTGIHMLWGPTNLRHIAEIVHYQSHYYTIVFIMLHFGGITVTELFMEKGVASKMIHG